jgi:hypothetical protein
MKRKTRIFLLGMYLLNLSIVNLSKLESTPQIIGSIIAVAIAFVMISKTLFKKVK